MVKIITFLHGCVIRETYMRKEEFYELLKRIKNDKKSRIEQDVRYFLEFSLTPTIPIVNLNKYMLPDLVYMERLRNSNGTIRIDDDICQILSEIIFDEKIDGYNDSTKLYCAELLMEADWPEEPELSSSLVSFFRFALSNTDMWESFSHELRIELIKGMKRIINFAPQTRERESNLKELLLEKLEKNYFDSDFRWRPFIDDGNISLKIVETLSDVNDCDVDHIGLFLLILRNFDEIKKPNHLDRADPTQSEIKAYQEKEAGVMRAIVQALGRYAGDDSGRFNNALIQGSRYDNIQPQLPQPIQLPDFNAIPAIHFPPLGAVGPGVFFGFGQQPQAMLQLQPNPVLPAVHMPGFGGSGSGAT
jgi:hypothetical protein